MKKQSYMSYRQSVFLALITLIALLFTATAALASEGGVRRIDTGDVNDSHDVRAIDTDANDEEKVHDDESTHEDDEAGHEAVEDSHAEEVEAGHSDDEAAADEHEDEEHVTEEESHSEESEEAHHPAWMIPGWQSIFTVLAVIYFGLGVKLLPYLMAKEEH